jgi:hypothetical protein
MSPQLAEGLVLLTVIGWLARLWFRRPSRVLPFLGMFLIAPALGLLLQAAGVDLATTARAEWAVVGLSGGLALVFVAETWRPSRYDRDIEEALLMGPQRIRDAERRAEERGILRHRSEVITSRLLLACDEAEA